MKLREKTITLEIFEFAVSRYFAPIAKRLELPISRLKDDLYEIQSPYFSMRIQYTKGHIGKGILTTLFPAKERPANVEDEPRSLGIGIIAKYYGVDMQTNLVRVIEDFLNQAEYIAKVSEKLCTPYLLGQKNDFDQIKPYLARTAWLPTDK
jgi:hypothetical protein